MYNSMESSISSNETSPALAVGKPRFANAQLAHALGEEGALFAWRQAFKNAGVKAPETVSGDFAIAFCEPDGRTFLAIDRFAIRSLCYRQVGNRLLFAERADQLADSTTEIDPQAIFDYLYTHAIPSPRTIYKGYLPSAAGTLRFTRK
jgi:asparagine synthase (glutamine-hydrolysing)